MLTLDKIKAMTPKQRTTAFEALAVAHYGPNYKTALAADFGTFRQTVGVWVRTDSVSIEMILALEAMQMQKAAQQIRDAIAQLTAT